MFKNTPRRYADVSLQCMCKVRLIVKTDLERHISGRHTEKQHLFCTHDTKLELISMRRKTVALSELAK